MRVCTLFALVASIHFAGSDSIYIPSSCDNLVDGVHYVKPSSDGEVIPVVCNDGYTIINLQLNQESVASYFTSWYQTHWDENGIFSPDCDVLIDSDETDNGGTSWRDWWSPATSDTKFRVSKDCVSCESSLSYGDNTAYYMTNYYFCLNKFRKTYCQYSSDELLAMDDLSFDKNASIGQCNICDDAYRGTGCSSDEWCDCMSLQLDADTKTDTNHDSCIASETIIVKPSISNDGHYCTCYQTETDAKTSSGRFKIDYQSDDELESILPKIQLEQYNEYVEKGIYIDSRIRVEEESDSSQNDDINEKSCSQKVFYLSNNDFQDGTYKIRECGNYILTEDILVHFNKPDESDLMDVDWSPNGYHYENFPWYPRLEQEYGYDSINDFDVTFDAGYQGATSFHGSYQFGFFAAITVETDYVTIDLNDHKMEMDYIYYLQQRIFALIEISSKQFVGDQGPANLGRTEIQSLFNIEIKNGELGLTSHHGIHGFSATNVSISNVNVHDFDVAGIHCNGCNNVDIQDSVIGKIVYIHAKKKQKKTTKSRKNT